MCVCVCTCESDYRIISGSLYHELLIPFLLQQSLFGQLAKMPIWFDNTKQLAVSFYHSFSKILRIKPTTAISLSSNFSVLSASRFTILQVLMLHHRLSWFMLLFFFMFSHLCGFVAVARISFTSVSLFCIYRMSLTVKVLVWEFIYVLPTLFASPYCLTDVGSSGKELVVLEHLTPVSWGKTHRNFLWIRVQFTEANVRNTP